MLRSGVDSVVREPATAGATEVWLVLANPFRTRCQTPPNGYYIMCSDLELKCIIEQIRNYEHNMRISGQQGA